MAVAELTAESIYGTTLSNEMETQAANMPYSPPAITMERVGLNKVPMPSPIVSGEIEKPQFWEAVAKDSTYGKDFYDKLPLNDKAAGYVDFTFGGKAANDLVTTVRLFPDGTTRSVQRTKDEYNAAANTDPIPTLEAVKAKLKQQDAATAEAAKMLFGGVSVLERSAKAATDAAFLAANAVADRNMKVAGVNTEIMRGMDGLLRDVEAAGAAKAVRAQNRIDAVADPEVQKLARELLLGGLQRQKEIHEQERIAQQRLLDMQNNPLQQAASVLYGGPDKNPYLLSAAKTVDSLATERTNVQQQVNSALEGVSRFQAAREKQFLIETPAEVRAQTAEDIQKIKVAGAAIARANAGLPAETASEYAKAFELNFKNQSTVLERQISANQALMAGANRETVAALALENAAIHKQIADQANETKNRALDLKQSAQDAGLNPNRAPEVARMYWQLKNYSTDLPDAKAAQQNFNDGLKRKDPVLQAMLVLEEGKTASPLDNWKIVSSVFQQFPRLAEFYPQLQVAVKPGENGYERWVGIVNGVEAAKKVYAGPQGAKLKDEKVVNQLADQAYFKAVATTGIQTPDVPLSIKVDGKVVPLTDEKNRPVRSPYAIFPGKYLAAAGETNVTALPEMLKRAISPEVNLVAAEAAKAEQAYALAPKSFEAARKTVGAEEIVGAAIQARKNNPTLTLDQAASQGAAIYQAGVWLNNLQGSYEKFGLPTQTDYVVEFERKGFIAAIVGGATRALQNTPTWMPNIFDKPGLDLKNAFDETVASPFYEVPNSSLKVDLTSPAKWRNLLLSSTSPKFWDEGK